MNRRYQFFPAVIILAAVFVLSGCSGKKDRIFFEAEELSKIELYRFIIPSDAEKKVASDQEEIRKICDALRIELKENKLSPATGSEVTSFRLYFTDGRTAEIIYTDSGKNNKIVSLFGEEELTGQTTADLGAVWERCTAQAVMAKEQELPMGRKLTLKQVIELAEKGMDLSWEDFESYPSTYYGSGLMILRYEIDADYYLLIGGGSKEEKPMYIQLVRKGNQEEFIDIRTEDIEGFISDNTTQSDRLEDASGSSNAEENANNGRASMVGRCLISTDGQYLIIDENGAPIVLSNQSENEQMFEKLQSGDKIQITFDGIQETYPAQTGVYTCELLEKGSMEEIPTETVGSLQELGWTF